MKLENFIKGYKKSQDLFLQDHVKKIYVPFTAKIADCKMIISQAYYETDETTGVRTYSPNSVLANYLLDLVILKRYTDIEELGDNGLETYDKLCEFGLVEAIKNRVDANELDMYTEIYIRLLNDTKDKETNIVMALKSLSKAMPDMINAMAELEKRGVNFGKEIES